MPYFVACLLLGNPDPAFQPGNDGWTPKISLSSGFRIYNESFVGFFGVDPDRICTSSNCERLSLILFFAFVKPSANLGAPGTIRGPVAPPCTTISEAPTCFTNARPELTPPPSGPGLNPPKDIIDSPLTWYLFAVRAFCDGTVPSNQRSLVRLLALL